MVLNRKGPQLLRPNALTGVVVEVQVGQFHIRPGKGIKIDTEPMVLAGDLDLPRLEVLDWMIGPAMPELELVSLPPSARPRI